MLLNLPVLDVTKLFWCFSHYYLFFMSIGAELGGAAGARAPPLFTPRPEIYSIKCA